MERRPRPSGVRVCYPTMEAHPNRRSFLVRLGAASGLIVLGGASLGSRSGDAGVTELPDGTFELTLPEPPAWWARTPEDYWHLQLLFRVRAQVASEDVAVALASCEIELRGSIDAVLAQHDPHDLDDPRTLEEVEGEILDVMESALHASGISPEEPPGVLDVTLEWELEDSGEGELAGMLVDPNPFNCSIG